MTEEQIKAKFAPDLEKIQEYKKRSSGQEFEYETPEGIATAKSSVSELKKIKSSSEAIRKELKQPYLDTGKAIDKVGKEVKVILEAMINVHKVPLDAITNKAKDRKRHIENRVAWFEETIRCIPEAGEDSYGPKSKTLKELLAEVRKIEIVEELYGDMQLAAYNGKEALIAALEEEIPKAKKAERKAASVRKALDASIHREIVSALVKSKDVDLAAAEAVYHMIESGEVPNVHIEY